MKTKEAIERVRSRFDKWALDEEDLEALRALGLVDESEDERIRKELMNFVAKVKDIAKSGRDSWAVRKEDVEMCERFLAYLEKQKESLHVSETCKENADSFTDEDERIKEWLIKEVSSLMKSDLMCDDYKANARKALAWLEKQKEQNAVPSRETILGIWELGNLWEEYPEERDGLTKLQFIQKHWIDKNDYNSEEPKEKQKERKSVEKPDLVAELKHHLATTPKEQLEKEWKELEPWGNIGPTVEEYLYGKQPAEWSKFDSYVLQDAITAADLLGNGEEYKESHPHLSEAFRVAKDWLKDLPNRISLHPKQEWNEEDRKMLFKIMDYLKVDRDEHPERTRINDMLSWLINIPNRVALPNRKLSKSQMNALEQSVISYRNHCGTDPMGDIAKSAIEDLKKLM